MPYINKDKRLDYADNINELVDILSSGNNTFNSGELNYVISKICVTLLNKNLCYTTANTLIGVLECVKQELYRKQISQYEDIKILENGEI